MTTNKDRTNSGGPPDTEGVPDEVIAAVQAREDIKAEDPKPAWADLFVWSALWKVVAVGFTVVVGLVVVFRAQTLLRLLALSIFFALAMVPGVKYMHERWGWKRGAAVGVIYASLLLIVTLMVVVLIPGIVEFAEQVGENGDEWTTDLNTWTEDTFGFTVIEQSSGDAAAAATDEAVGEWSSKVLGLASTGIGLIFNLATMALFTFYFAADYDRIERAIMSRMPPERQQVYGWVSDTALEQTGGYFYSRALLMVINAALFFVVMVLIGLPVAFAFPLAAFEAFVATFIPAVGTYIGSAVPILVTLAVLGLGAALILLVWTILYQQIENYWLSPKLSAQTMELNGGVAFGAALAGGAIAGPMGAFVSLPVAALITSVVSNLGKTYDVVYHSKYEGKDPDQASDDEAGAEEAAASTQP